MNDDTIKRSDAIKAVWKPQVKPNELIFDALKTAIESEINNVPTADRPQGEVDAVEIYERAERRLERGDISLGEFEDIIEPLRHLFYNRPQGEWKSVKASIYPYGYDVECSVCGFRMGSSFGYKYCPMCGCRMKGADDER